VLVNNARYVGPGHADLFLDTPIPLIETAISVNVVAPLVLSQLVIPWMAKQGGGRIINMTSTAAYANITRPPGEGGWSLGYGITKGALHRIAGALAVELEDQGILAFNVQPGTVMTERGLLRRRTSSPYGAPPEVIGAVVAWLAESPDATAWNGKTVEAQFLCHERGLLPGWSGPMRSTAPLEFDDSAAAAARLEADLP
jgi:NAD(P)-dependent dehydrogenase (short-subunit alcohol dehydrogenase family)